MKKIKILILIIILSGFTIIIKPNVNATKMNEVTVNPKVTDLETSQLGNPVMQMGDYIKNDNRETSSQIFNKKPKNFASEFFVYSTYPVSVSMPIQQHWNTYTYRSAGSIYEYIATFSNSNSKTFEKEATTKLALRYENSASLTFGIMDFAKIGASTIIGINGSVTNKVKNSTNLQWGSSLTEKHKIEYEEDGIYMFETRGMFKATVITVFKTNLRMVNYTQHNKGIFKYHTWSYEVANYQSIEEYIVYSYIPDSAYTGIFKYNWNSTNRYWQYDDFQMDNVYMF